ncbi:hypothetical protein [Dinghuibacter silviterrae]|uniref:Uncharacterized protein n=1 Tax=Dinghuibacter silviterrae TaxID=1539049 RepID=A0A4R8DJS6_9BACT|nr:hypothetical protein [Dinghuibacter silviterrae]TDW97436.1 hypothetical protein EDB95_5285 [Dinghuibacter silviterrae]
MKKSTLSLWIGCLFTLILSSARAQNECGGVYLTSSDYLAGKAYPAKTLRGKSWSNGEDLLGSKRLLVDLSGQLHETEMAAIYAVKCCNGNIVRIFQGGTYMLLNPGGSIPMYKVTIGSSGKGDYTIVKYFFSKDAAADIQELTVDNLRDAFADNKKFDDALIQFRSDRDLASYDKKQKCFRLDKVYSETH